MLDVLLMIVAMAVGGGEGNQGAEMANDTAAPATPAPVETAEPAAAAPVVAEAEPQVATGKFTTATEVKPILTMTKGNWVAVREYDGHDLVYFTHLMSWRCGLSAMRYSLNDGPLQVYDLPPCDEASATPNAIPSDWLPISGLPPQSVEKVYVEIFYDDLSTDSASFDRAGVEIQ
ncbi:hypothetical protein TL5118_03624 [Thalassovita autumnalis]|uniref:Uncharacterized protein n=1 Tax=Thalassovita autumnalis TaxID=2072972 RepID=A0A0P1FVH9_9RHOB|nr:hypothetical protein [Thalassovita autumnalis]CUH69654.1 hypothetical protein TL5118_03624 [Thalassovita autumnalis]CUH73057.1 hypothetical protein TL5120_02864 [Thalassovita autumnalis]